MSDQCLKDSYSTKENPRVKIINSLIIFLLVPATILIFWRFGERKYYFASILIIIYSMIPFFRAFEKRKPEAREIVTIAVMCAIAVASRAAFIMIPHFKPMTGIIIITGIAFGAEAGFLTGTLSAVVSNFIFGQGPWTPWQMFAYGIAGFLAGYFYKKGIISKKRISLCIFGGMTVILIVGPILDTCALFTMSSVINKATIEATYLSGLPVNIIHAVATVITLFVLSRPMFEKLDRIKLKYGMDEYEI